MSLYRNAAGEIKDIPDERYAAWVAASNPKASSWRLLVIDTVPAFNAATQKVVNGGYVADGAIYRQTWSVVTLSQAETDAAADTAEDNALLSLWSKFADDTITANQQKRVLKRLFKAYLKEKGLTLPQ